MNQRLKFAVLVGGTLLVVGGGYGDLVCGKDRGSSSTVTYRSSSERFLLDVTSISSVQQGAAECCLSRDRREVWRKVLPYTLSKVRVLDDGTVVACAYSQGFEGIGGQYAAHHEDYGDVVFMILNRQGTIRVREAFHRAFAPRLMSPQRPEPLIEDLVVDLENDRVVVLISWNVYQLITPPVTVWRTYQLSTGKPLGAFYPAEQMKGAQRLGLCVTVQPLPGTALLLAQWHRIERGLPTERSPIYGTHFALLDKECRPVWQLTLRDDYEVSGNEERERRLSAWIAEKGAILSVHTPGQFDLFSAKTSQRVSFIARQDEQGRWVVSEIGRKYFTPRAILAPQTP